MLIDEAQDTSPKQWEIVKTIAVRVHARRRARPNVKRTIFAVGDEKQSIFSFQGAAPHAFDDMRRLFAAPVRHAGAGLAASALPPLVPLRAERARLGRPRVRGARGLCERHHRRDRHPRAPGAARHRAGAGRNLGPDQAGGQEGDRRLGRALRHRKRGKPAGAARPPHRRPRQALARARPEGRRRVDPGAPARAAVRGHHPRAEERRRAGRRRRPAGAHRAHRGDGPDGAGRLPAAGGRRSRVGERAEEPAVRHHRRTVVRAGLAAQGLAARQPARQERTTCCSAPSARRSTTSPAPRAP